jgi:uncharacterized protein YcaQ
MAHILRKAKPGSSALSLAEARRIALHAQGFTAAREPAPSRAQMLHTIKRIGLLQLDSVNVLVRSHYLPLFARHGAYAVKTLDAMSQKSPRALFEYWGHEASLIPVDYHPLFRWRMDEARAGKGTWAGPARLARERPGFIAAVLTEIAERGPLGAGELSNGGKSTGNWWGWSDGKRALEYLFWTGLLTSAGRRGFERLYALPERVIPARILNAAAPPRDAAQHELMNIAAAAHGVATEVDLRDYFRLGVADTKARIAELLEEGVLRRVAVEGWTHQAYLHRDATLPQTVDASALIAPFDSLIWMRPRTERLFDFHYRLAFYTPKHKRKAGYYVMPFLLGDRLVARADLKSDRKQSLLLVLGGHAEPHIAPHAIAPQLKAELARLAHWLGLKRVAPRGRGELVRALRNV